MNLNKEKNNPKLILLMICEDYLMFLLSLELQRSFNSSTIELKVKINFNFISLAFLISKRKSVMVCDISELSSDSTRSNSGSTAIKYSVDIHV
ncbi:hypothetical protein BpHYR1_021747 [Brachionus plicatilis]|uniref:Uncharacterized protein n=1 Tax=Brachionus plicatilis TaxID=10195 RepID=A0A3M7T204_BRAPC|nr:hypothetical protein BpHYR1_021747 [Brachionus plicatilis]